MLTDFLSDKIRQQLPFEPTEEQTQLINELSLFLLSKEKDSLFLLKGYAGTGKTSIIGSLIKVLNEVQSKTMLMAPTGRAAKVFTSYANHPATTVHKKIYRQKSASDFHFEPAINLHKHTLFIVDEASMISNTQSGSSIFGSGRLLDDLIHFVYNGEGCRLLLMGDDAQLPPVGQQGSPALEKGVLEAYGFTVHNFSLSKVVRQSEASGILFNATAIRNEMTQWNPTQKPTLTISNFSDIKRIKGDELIDALIATYNNTGISNSLVITRSNKSALLYNRGIRNQVLQKEEELSSGDLLMVNKNNYFWSKNYENLEFIANGDSFEVVRIKKQHELYDLHFADVSLRFLDYDMEIDARILMESLYAETPADIENLNRKLFEKVSEDYMDIGNKKDRMKKIMADEYYNALQVKFGYAVTCHKAQGGQWDTVFIDQGYLPEILNSDYLNWLYTAITRAVAKVYLVNFSDDFFNK